MAVNKNDEKEDNKKHDNKVEIDIKEFWILVRAAYKVVLPFVALVVFIYFLFTLFLDKIMK